MSLHLGCLHEKKLIVRVKRNHACIHAKSKQEYVDIRHRQEVGIRGMLMEVKINETHS